MLISIIRNIITLTFIFGFNYLFSQDTLQAWVSKIDSSLFKIHYNKKEIPSEFYSIIRIKNIDQIAGENDQFQIGCTGTKNSKTKKLNWLAKDTSNHWVLSVSTGGRFYGTTYYYIEKNQNKLFVNDVSFFGSMRNGSDELIFIETIKFVRENKMNKGYNTLMIELK